MIPLTFPLELHMCQHFVDQKFFIIILQLKFGNVFLSTRFLPLYTVEDFFVSMTHSVKETMQQCVINRHPSFLYVLNDL
jgi:hypothetical protein